MEGGPGEEVMTIRIPRSAGNTLLSWTTLVSQVKLCFLYLFCWRVKYYEDLRFVARVVAYRNSECYTVFVEQSKFTIMSLKNTIKYGNFCVKISQVVFRLTDFTLCHSSYNYCCQMSLHFLAYIRNVAPQFYFGWHKMLYSGSYCRNRSSVVGIVPTLRGEQTGARTPVGVRDLLFSTTFKPTLGLSQTPINGYWGLRRG